MRPMYSAFGSPAKSCGDDGQRCDLVPLVGGIPSGSNPEINVSSLRRFFLEYILVCTPVSIILVV